MHGEFGPLCAQIQANCHISDARYAGDYTLCIYLLKMREFYRWERGYELDAVLDKEAVGQWLKGREQMWDELGDDDYQPLPVDGTSIDPFDTAAVNRHLLPHGLVYSGGLGRHAKPVFFLARLVRREIHDGVTVLITADEYARELAAPPALSRDNTVFIRRDALRRLLWEKVEEWRWAQRENAMARAMACYGFERDPRAALEHMTDKEVEVALLHEIGEVMAGAQIGDGWHDMLSALPRSRVEIAARAVRDHLADAIATLPGLLERDEAGPLHFYFANLSSMRKLLFPRLSTAYETWVRDDDLGMLRDLVPQAREHWLELARRMCDAHRAYGSDCLPHMDSLIEAGRL